MDLASLVAPSGLKTFSSSHLEVCGVILKLFYGGRSTTKLFLCQYAPQFYII